MTEHRGPDFLPYPLPERPSEPVVSTAVVEPTTGRWTRALEALPPLGVLAVGAGAAAVVLLVLVSGAMDQPGAGAIVTVLAAATSLVAGFIALSPSLPQDTRRVIVAAQSAGVVAAALSVVVYASSRPAEQPPISIPSPQPTATATAPAPSASPTPLLSLPPGSVNGFGVPSDPGRPQSSDPTALGTLFGHVVDTAARPVEGATVTVTRSVAGDVSSTPDCPTRVTTQTDAEGVYRLQLCQLGPGLGYKVTVTVGRSTASSNLFVNSGNTTVYDVILPR